MSYSNLNQTGLIPRGLFAKSENNNVSMEINAGGITIGADLLTTPFYGVISAQGISTTNPLGFNLLSTTNFNDQALTNIGSEAFFDGLSITDACNNSITSNTTTGDMNITCVSGITLELQNDMNFNSTGGGLLASMDYFQLIATNQYINLESLNNITLTSNGGSVNLEAPTGNINLSCIGGIAEIRGGTTYILSQTDNISISAETGVGITAVTTMNLNADESILINSNTDNVTLQSFGTSYIQSLDSNIVLTSNVSNITLNAVTSEVIMNTTQMSVTDAVSSTTYIQPSLIRVGTNGNNDDLGSISIATITSSAFTPININPGNSFSLVDNGYVNWYGRPMSMTFLHKWSGSFSYPFSSTNTWDISQTTTTSFPLQFLHSTWAVSFSINFHSQGATGDKAFACYIDFADGNGTQFSGFTFNQNTPYAQWFNPSTYTATSQNPMIITMTDYFDFTGAVNQLDIRLNYYADSNISQNYSITSAFTLMSLIT